MPRDLILDRLFHHAATRPRDPALSALGPDERWRTLGYAAVERRVRAFAAACVAAEMPPGGVVALLADNHPDWVLGALGAQAAGGVAAGIYQNASIEQVEYILRHSEAHLIAVDSDAQWQKVRARLDHLPALRRVVFISGAAAPDHPLCQTLDAFLAVGASSESAALARAAAIQGRDLASLIYTSGTTGTPKGVMLTHDNLAWTSRQAASMIQGITHHERIVSYLPLAHIAEQMFSVYLAAHCGYQVFFAGGFDKVRAALTLARPTVFLGVPRVWEKLRGALQQRFAAATGVKAALLSWARGVALRAGAERLASGSPSPLLRLQEAVADRLVLGKIRAALGLDALQVAITGSAATSRDVMDFFLSLGLPLHEVYGQSEVTGPTTFNRPEPGKTRLGTVGLPVPGVEVRLAEDGEILVRGGNVFVGYYKDPEATAETLRDGWLHSGDVGEFDRDGFLRITDRKKDLIKTSGGKYAAPQPIEKQLQDIDVVGHAVVIGESRKYLSAVVTLDPTAVLAFARKESLPAVAGFAGDVATPELLARLAADPAIIARIQAGVDRMNQGLARPETIKRFAVLPTEFTVESGELTPSQKVRRRAVAERHAAAIDALYPPE